MKTFKFFVGTRLEEINFLVTASTVIIFQPVDAVEEFRVESSVANAQFGRGRRGSVRSSGHLGSSNLH